MQLRKILPALPALILLLVAGMGQAQTLDEAALVEALRQGGLVIVMRHASSPREEPDAASANADNTGRERQLDAAGRAAATALGSALRGLGIPIREVGSSPTYRAMETARLMGFSDIETHEELGNEGMRASAEAFGAWLREQIADVPADGNRLLITHAPNMSNAFAAQAEGMGEGDALIFRPDGTGGAELLGRVAIDDWADL